MHAYDVELDGLKVFDFTEVGVLAWIAELMKHRKADDSPVSMRSSRRRNVSWRPNIAASTTSATGWRVRR